MTDEECEQLISSPSPHLEWGSLGGGRGVFLNNASELTELKLGRLDEQSAVSYGDDDGLFQYLTFQLLVLPLMMLIIAVSLNPPQHVTAGGRGR